MSINIDKILELIDVGLQHTSEPNMESIERDRCARCQMNGLEGDGDLCGPCRAYLLGDAEVDPRHRFKPCPTDHVHVPAGRSIWMDTETHERFTAYSQDVGIAIHLEPGISLARASDQMDDDDDDDDWDDDEDEGEWCLDLTPGVTINIEDFIVDHTFHTSNGRTIGYGELWFPPDEASSFGRG